MSRKFIIRATCYAAIGAVCSHLGLYAFSSWEFWAFILIPTVIQLNENEE